MSIYINWYSEREILKKWQQWRTEGEWWRLKSQRHEALGIQTVVYGQNNWMFDTISSFCLMHIVKQFIRRLDQQVAQNLSQITEEESRAENMNENISTLTHAVINCVKKATAISNLFLPGLYCSGQWFIHYFLTLQYVDMSVTARTAAEG